MTDSLRNVSDSSDNLKLIKYIISYIIVCIKSWYTTNIKEKKRLSYNKKRNDYPSLDISSKYSLG